MSTRGQYMLGHRQHDVLAAVQEGQQGDEQLAEYIGCLPCEVRTAVKPLVRRGLLTEDHQLTPQGVEAMRRKAARGYEPGVKGTSKPRGTAGWRERDGLV